MKIWESESKQAKWKSEGSVTFKPRYASEETPTAIHLKCVQSGEKYSFRWNTQESRLVERIIYRCPGFCQKNDMYNAHCRMLIQPIHFKSNTSKKIYWFQSCDHLLLLSRRTYSIGCGLKTPWFYSELISLMRPGPDSVHTKIFLLGSYQYFPAHLLGDFKWYLWKRRSLRWFFGFLKMQEFWGLVFHGQ